MSFYSACTVLILNSTVTTWVVHMGMLELIKLLVGKGMNIHAGNGAGARPIHHAAWSGNVECMAFLIQEGADVHQTAPFILPLDSYQLQLHG